MKPLRKFGIFNLVKMGKKEQIFNVGSKGGEREVTAPSTLLETAPEYTGKKNIYFNFVMTALFYL